MVMNSATRKQIGTLQNCDEHFIHSHTRMKHDPENQTQIKSAAMGIRTPVAGVKGPHDWPDYTIAANCLFTFTARHK